MKNNKEIVHCFVDYGFKRIGGKYKGRILWVLKGGVLRYGELKRAIVGITPKMLTQTLRELEADELVHRKVYLEVPPKVEYALTTTGKELIPFIEQLRSWAKNQMEQKNIT
ncbi:helix-turn-helix transcriptional regulator [Kordia sp. YSTF-M3]|uniref:Helix-turn-helix transcriptional regulator n=1 Tax=Kordia aestuariivivens TaxID=2759037 RepID=A0ABR7QCS5_9FLAO|nr:helix-turn-helix domain-containing protein [Kordia aestuariivivens]MBC8756377.1 helix-turn-helix transcriptional regulator [Kordia aestuariivivens]